MEGESNARLLAKLRDELGDTICGALDDPRVIEILLNEDGGVWIERLGKERVRIDELAAAQASAAIGTVAAALDEIVDATQPILQGELPIGGFRFQATIPPVSRAPAFAIRKRPTQIITLSDYEASDALAPETAQMLREAIDQHKNVLVAGGTGSGKTTFVNSMIHEIVTRHPSERFAIIEDTREIVCFARDRWSARTDTRSGVTMTTLLKCALRMSPDRILVGEVRGGEALDMLKAWNTGHPGGLCTLHANSATEALVRLEQMIAEVSANRMPEVVAMAVDLCVFLQRGPDRVRRITEVVRVDGYANGTFATTPVFQRGT